MNFHQLYTDNMEIKEEKTEIDMFAETKQENVQVKKEVKQEHSNDTRGK